MSSKLILYFTAAEHALYREKSGGLELVAEFPAGDEGLADFRALLPSLRGSLVYILADLAGEDFHEDQIPYLRGGDRESVVQRRLAQRYRDTRLAAALSLGTASGERRNERLLLASFTNTQQFTPWLDALTETGMRLAGVYSVPLLAPALVARLGARGGRAFVVTLNSTGLRQCFVDEGRLRFARLERTAEMAPEALAAFVRAETLRLLQYLSTLRALPREGPPLQVWVVAPTRLRDAFQQALASDTRLSFLTTSMEEASRKVGAKRLPGDASGEQLFLHLTLRNAPKEQFARIEDRRSFVMWRLQRAIVAAGAAGFAACALFAATQWLEISNLRNHNDLQRREAREATQQYERITASFPVTQTTTDNLKATVTEFTKVAAQSAAPEPALVYLSRVVEKFPQIDIESVQWRIGRPEERGDPSRRSPPPARVPGAKPPPVDNIQILEVSGRVNAIKRSDYRAITGQVQQFAEALRTDPTWTILRTQLPFDVTSEGTLSGDMGTTEGSEAPRFTIQVGRVQK